MLFDTDEICEIRTSIHPADAIDKIDKVTSFYCVLEYPVSGFPSHHMDHAACPGSSARALRFFLFVREKRSTICCTSLNRKEVKSASDKCLIPSWFKTPRLESSQRLRCSKILLKFMACACFPDHHCQFQFDRLLAVVAQPHRCYSSLAE